ncbi:hypothetical protein PR202_gb05371 [Eleusine coracana subsp. coracana]|uniref:FRIGIDA-like protein n=1 Tax=Eleusine coracana subsp. coracana TaxID=191504 RepID=A0AAV5E6S6_ELECO|nr:hypothetical protein PR202_gb05371 [Eleusine coracana subsp. coracana]
MRWSESDRECYCTVVEHLAAAGNPACFLVGLTLVFADRRVPPGVQSLAHAAAAGHKAVEEAVMYIRQVEDETDVDEANPACVYMAKKRINRENEAVRELMWNITVMPTSPALLGHLRSLPAVACGKDEVTTSSSRPVGFATNTPVLFPGATAYLSG